MSKNQIQEINKCVRTWTRESACIVYMHLYLYLPVYLYPSCDWDIYSYTKLNKQLELQVTIHETNDFHIATGWNDKIVILKKTTLQLYFKTFIEKINPSNLIM